MPEPKQGPASAAPAAATPEPMAERESRGEWRRICAACADGTPPERCVYYGEPDGCNAPVRGQHPAGDVAERLKEELADAHEAIGRLEAELAEARRERDTACAERALSAAPGNAAAMREALTKIRDKCVIYNNDLAEEIDAICGNALSAPARNCDRFRSTVAAMEEWEKYPQSRYKGCRVCPHGDASMVSPSHLTLAEWLFAPEEGVVK